jgi:hypothetical protein
MTRRTLPGAALVAALFLCGSPLAVSAQSDPDVYVSTGSRSQLLFGAGGADFAAVFAGTGGFRPEEMALAGDGRLYICDGSRSEIFRFDPATALLSAVYARNSAVAPNDPEQPKGCTIAGEDLLFLSRNGNGNSAKTGLWAIRDVTGPTPSRPVLLLALHAVGGMSGQGLAVSFDGRVFFTFGNEVWVATPQPGSGGIGAGSDFRRWGFTAGEGFGIATRGIPNPLTGGLRAQVFVAAKFSGVVEVLAEAGGIGTAAGCAAIDVPHLPGSLEFDGAGDLWVTTSEQSNGGRGEVYEVDAPSCGPAPFAIALRAGGLGAAAGLALTPTGSDPVTLTFAPGSEKSDTVGLCTSTFNLDQVAQVCQDTWTVSCRLMPKPEFETRTGYAVGAPAGTLSDVVQQDFSFTRCADFPGAGGNCTEVRIKQTAASQCTEADVLDILANWQFFSLADLAHPGLLYSPDDFPTDPAGNPQPADRPFSENIMVDFDPLPAPTDPLDPRATGSRDAWGSGLVVVEDAPNRPPTAVLAVSPSPAQCGAPVTLDGAGSFDNDWNIDHRDSITDYTFSVNGELQQSSALDFLLFDTTGLAPGTHTASLQVSDEGWDVNGPLSDSTEVTFQIAADGVPPVISAFALQSLGDPRVTIGADGNAAMWPPNHEMVAFKALYSAYDACQANCRLVITSDEAAEGTGDGDQSPDIAITGQDGAAFFFDLRAERAQSGDGRVYTVRLECGDGAQTSTSAPITVSVPSNGSG